MGGPRTLLLLAIFKGDRGQRVDIGHDGIKVRAGFLRSRVIPLAHVLAVYTTMMPSGEDFHEVLAIETSTQGETLVLDPEEGFDTSLVIQDLQRALGGRWDDVYLGHKHLSKVRGVEPPP